MEIKYTLPLTFPGAYIRHPVLNYWSEEAQDWRQQVGSILGGIESQLRNAGVALQMFEETTAQREKFHAWKQEILALPSVDHKMAAKLEWERQSQFVMRQSHIYARAFTFAFDYIDKFLSVLADSDSKSGVPKTPHIPPDVKAARDSFRAAFPHLKGIRDSAHNVEDRVRGLGRGGKPIELQPLHDYGIEAPNGIMIMDLLVGDKFVFTTAEGVPGELEVNDNTLECARQIVQRVIEAFDWGPRSRPGLPVGETRTS